jgi:oligopeptide transport system substrate-binding protein
LLAAVALGGSLGAQPSMSAEPMQYKGFVPSLAGDSAGPTGTITIAGTPFDSWDPHYSSFGQDVDHFYMVWRGLYEFDKDMVPVSSMAAGVPAVSNDGRTYTVTLRSGLMWSDGQPLTAADFVAGIQRSCNPDIASNYQYILSNVAGCDEYRDATDASAGQKEQLRNGVGAKALNPQTIEFTLESAQPSFGSILALWPTFPVPRHKVPAVNAPWPGPMANVYNGPFMPAVFAPEQRIELVPNPAWAGSVAKVGKIVVHYVDLGVASAAYRAGVIDATAVNSPELGQLQSEFPTQIHLYAANRTIGLQFNMGDALLAKPGVRLALSRAVDRDVLNLVIFQGGNAPTTSWVPPHRNGLVGGEYDGILGFDPAAARQHLADAGYAGGAGWPGLTLTLTDSATNRATGEFLRFVWADHLGIEVTLEFVSSAERTARFNAIDYQLLVGGWQEDYPDPENWFLGQWETGGTINKAATSIPALDALLAEARFNPNDAARREQYREAEMILLQEANGIAPLWHLQSKFLVKPYISGMVENKRGNDQFVPGSWSPEHWDTTKP